VNKPQPATKRSLEWLQKNTKDVNCIRVFAIGSATVVAAVDWLKELMRRANNAA
jgi:hypothetical protein